MFSLVNKTSNGSLSIGWNCRKTWEVASFISLVWQERYHIKADKYRDTPFKCSFIILDDIGLRNKSAICLTSRIHLREPPFTISGARFSWYTWPYFQSFETCYLSQDHTSMLHVSSRYLDVCFLLIIFYGLCHGIHLHEKPPCGSEYFWVTFPIPIVQSRQI